MNNNVKTKPPLEVYFNDDGYLKNFERWDIEIGKKIAKDYKIELSMTHWNILSWLQEQFKTKKELSLNNLVNTGIADIDELKQLFTSDPFTVSTKIAGLPKDNNNDYKN